MARKKKNRIAVISSSVFNVNPDIVNKYSGLELMVYYLTEGLIARKYDTTLIAPQGSYTEGGKVIETISADFTLQAFQKERQAFDVYKNHLPGFDVVIDHTWFKYSVLAKRDSPDIMSNTEIINVIHGMPNWRNPPPIPNSNLVGLSVDHSQFISSAYGVPCRYVHNGIDLNLYPLKKEKTNYYLSLNRISSFKGIHEIVSILNRTRKHGWICGEDMFVESQQYVARIMDKCDQSAVKYIGKVDLTEKIHYLQNARALIACPLWPAYMEAFGLFAVEANACGTPVIALKNGGLKDIIKDGTNGFLCNNTEEMFDIVRSNKIEELNPLDCRKAAENFSKINMVNDYIKLIKDVINGNRW